MDMVLLLFHWIWAIALPFNFYYRQKFSSLLSISLSFEHRPIVDGITTSINIWLENTVGQKAANL